MKIQNITRNKLNKKINQSIIFNYNRPFSDKTSEVWRFTFLIWINLDEFLDPQQKCIWPGVLRDVMQYDWMATFHVQPLGCMVSPGEK